MAKTNGKKPVIDPKQIKKGLAVVFSIGLVAALIIIATTFDPETIDVLKKANISLLAIALLLTLTSYFFNGVTMWIFATALGQKNSLWVYFKIFLAATFASYVTPFGSGNLPTQIYLLTTQGMKTENALSIVTGRVLATIWFFGFIAPISAFFVSRQAITISFALPLAAIIGLTVLFIFFLYKPSTVEAILAKIIKNRLACKVINRDKLKKAADSLKNTIGKYHNSLKIISQKNPLTFFYALASQTTAWVLFILVIVLVVASLGWFDNLSTIFFRVLVLLAIIPFSPTPGGSGLAEGGATFILRGLAPLSLAGPAVLLWRFITFYLILAIGAIAFGSYFKNSLFSEKR